MSVISILDRTSFPWLDNINVNSSDTKYSIVDYSPFRILTKEPREFPNFAPGNMTVFIGNNRHSYYRKDSYERSGEESHPYSLAVFLEKQNFGKNSETVLAAIIIESYKRFAASYPTMSTELTNTPDEYSVTFRNFPEYSSRTFHNSFSYKRDEVNNIHEWISRPKTTRAERNLDLILRDDVVHDDSLYPYETAVIQFLVAAFIYRISKSCDLSLFKLKHGKEIIDHMCKLSSTPDYNTFFKMEIDALVTGLTQAQSLKTADIAELVRQRIPDIQALYNEYSNRLINNVEYVRYGSDPLSEKLIFQNSLFRFDAFTSTYDSAKGIFEGIAKLPKEFAENKEAILDSIKDQYRFKTTDESSAETTKDYNLFVRQVKSIERRALKIKSRIPAGKKELYLDVSLTPNHKLLYIYSSRIANIYSLASLISGTDVSHVKPIDAGITRANNNIMRFSLRTSSVCDIAYYLGYDNPYDYLKEMIERGGFYFSHDEDLAKRLAAVNKKWKKSRATITRSYQGRDMSSNIARRINRAIREKKKVTAHIGKATTFSIKEASTDPINSGSSAENVPINDGCIVNKLIVKGMDDTIYLVLRYTEDSLVHSDSFCKGNTVSSDNNYTDKQSDSTAVTRCKKIIRDISKTTGAAAIGLSGEIKGSVTGQLVQILEVPPTWKDRFVTDIQIDGASVFSDGWYKEIDPEFDITAILADQYNAYKEECDKLPWLWSYQKDDVSAAATLGRCNITSEMGTGKTRQQIGIAQVKHAKNALFVTKAGYILQFQEEFKKVGLPQPVVIKDKTDLKEVYSGNHIISYEDLAKNLYDADSEILNYTSRNGVPLIGELFIAKRKLRRTMASRKDAVIAQINDLEQKIKDTYVGIKLQNIENYLHVIYKKISTMPVASKLRHKFACVFFDEAHLIADPSANNISSASFQLKSKNRFLITGTAVTKGLTDFNMLYENYIKSPIHDHFITSRKEDSLKLALRESYDNPDGDLVSISKSTDHFISSYIPSITNVQRNKLIELYELVIGNRLELAAGKLIGDALSGTDGTLIYNYLHYANRWKYIYQCLQRMNDEVYKFRNRFTIRRIAKEDELKEKVPSTYTNKTVWILPEKDHVESYLSNLNNYKVNYDTVKDNESHIKNNLMQLMRSSFNPPGDSNKKLDILSSICKEHIAKEERVIVFFELNDHATLAKRYLSQQGLVVIATNNISTTQRAKDIMAFKAGDGDVLILTNRTGSHAYDIPEANVVIFAENPWQYYIKDQGFHRVLRPGQNKPVIVYTLINHGMIDEHIHTTIENRKTLSSNLIDRSDRILIDQTTYKEVSNKLMDTSATNVDAFNHTTLDMTKEVNTNEKTITRSVEIVESNYAVVSTTNNNEVTRTVRNIGERNELSG